MTRTTLKIDGMSCDHCVMSVRKALDGVDGVHVEDVAIGSASVEFDSAVTSTEDIVGAIGDAGYAAAPVA